MEWGVWPQRNIGLCLMKTLTCPSMCQRRTSVFGAVHSTKKKHGTLTEAEEESFQHHIKRRGRARDEKEKDKQEAKKDDSRHVITVDMQAVMQAPCGLVSQLYYKRKLSVYNFTTYSLSDGKGTCYTWDETEGKRGACEIATDLPIRVHLFPSCFCSWRDHLLSLLCWAELEPIFGDIVHTCCQHYPTRSIHYAQIPRDRAYPDGMWFDALCNCYC